MSLKTNLCYRKKTSHWVHSFIKRNTEYKKRIHKSRNTSFKEIKDNQSIFTQVTKWLANMGFSLPFWWVIVDCCVILNLMLGKAHNENVQQNPCIVCRWVSTLHLLTAPPPIIGYPPIFRIFQPHNFTAFQHFSNCIQILQFV